MKITTIGAPLVRAGCFGGPLALGEAVDDGPSLDDAAVDVGDEHAPSRTNDIAHTNAVRRTPKVRGSSISLALTDIFRDMRFKAVSTRWLVRRAVPSRREGGRADEGDGLENR